MITTDLQMVRPPQFCDPCGNELVNQATNTDERMNQIMRYCPHHKTLTLVTLDTINGERAIVKWIMESPCSEKRFVKLAHQMCDSLGAEMESLRSGLVQ